VRTLTLAVLASSVLAGCSRAPRNHWWQFWRRGAPSSVSDMDIAPGAPGSRPYGDLAGSSRLDGSLNPDVLAFDPGQLGEPEAIRSSPDGLLNLATVYFGYDSASVDSEGQRALRQNAEWIRANPGVSIRIEGHCDERGTEDYNYNLGMRRAQTVREHLTALGCDESRLHTWSWGELRPQDPGSGESAWARNRRVQFAVWTTE